MNLLVLFFLKQKTAYEMRISDWSSDVCSSDLRMTNLNRVALSAAIPSSIARRPFTRRVERTLFHHRGRRRGQFARCGLPVIAARFARPRPLDLPAILLAATDAVARAAFEPASQAAGLVPDAEAKPTPATP